MKKTALLNPHLVRMLIIGSDVIKLFDVISETKICILYMLNFIYSNCLWLNKTRRRHQDNQGQNKELHNEKIF